MDFGSFEFNSRIVSLSTLIFVGFVPVLVNSDVGKEVDDEAKLLVAFSQLFYLLLAPV